MIYIILAVLLFGALIAVHEFGHFITAKLSGVRVNEFAIGMGPAILKKQVGETLYALRIFPFGGYCAMEGEDSASNDPKSFSSKPVLSRMLIVLSGSFMNLIAGFLVLMILFIPVREWYTPVVSNIGFSGQTSENMLLPGDRIKEVDGYRVYLYGDIQTGILRGSDDGKYDILVVRNGEEKLLAGMRFVSDEETKQNDSGYTIEFEKEKSTFINKTGYILKNGFNIVRLVVVGLFDLIVGNVSTKDMSGPVGIGKVMVDTAKTSFSSLWYLLAFISINLGVMNLLPIPALDGGRFLFLVIEFVFRNRISPKYEGYVHMAGFIILMLLMVAVTYNDIVKLIMK